MRVGLAKIIAHRVPKRIIRLLDIISIARYYSMCQIRRLECTARAGGAACAELLELLLLGVGDLQEATPAAQPWGDLPSRPRLPFSIQNDVC